MNVSTGRLLVALVLLGSAWLSVALGLVQESVNGWQGKGEEAHEAHEGDEHQQWMAELIEQRSPWPAVLPAYQQECSGCHIAYPAQFLPESSWHQIMASLNDHFGDNAELDAAVAAEIEAYLVQHAANRPGGFTKMLNGLEQAAPLRITELPYHRRKHRKIPERLVGEGTEVRSFSQCEACHQSAERGIYDEDDVDIPNYGRWHD